ncbi:hypothetical protein FKG94_23075 [Exilibacterium tricleocarpae]|uniref:Hint domain-containing protein n=1 Tax=Exilibacterium tricleocarpae TaxID=2591008 RepID=A0A545SXK4_9GAMM|nr:RHS repeat-associated core domain-containing protein [Exilibacterium tricleocarpae]TQV69679.1 hypothetical protein FKG94_23075 [Exilibacterium tricleocarpae]
MAIAIKSLEACADARANITVQKGILRPFVFLLSLLIGCLLVSSAHAERTTTYYHTDAVGSVVAASDETGALLWRKSYRPYGEKVADGEGSLQSLSFTGKPHDEASGLTYMGARYYDPEVGRFMGIDAVGFQDDNPISFNRYAYANNNPYKYVDPDGNLPFLVPFVVIVAKEVAAEGFERATGLPAVFSMKGAAKYLSKRFLKKEGKKTAKGVCCFVAGTEVLTKDGYMAIEDIVLDQLVYSKDVDTGEQDWKPVTQLFKKYRKVYDLVVVDGFGEVQLVETTDDHPFYVMGRSWVETIELQPGDQIETEGHGWVVVQSVGDSGRHDITYNLEVADYHTYYATQLNLLVHNCNAAKKEKGKWDTPENWANNDHAKVRDRLRKENEGFESGRHNEYPAAMRKELRRMADEADARGDLPEYGQRLREISKTYQKREGAAHRGGR